MQMSQNTNCITAHQTTMVSLADRRRQWSYRLFGPTTLHLQHEFYLWISLSLLTVSSLLGLYRQGLLWGDAVLVMCVSLWLSRHFFMRWLCTHDTATAKNPTLVGVVVHWITSYVTAGQYMDRPDPQIVAKHAGTPQEDLASALYALHFLRVRLWYPLLRFKTWLSRDGQGRKRAVSGAQGRSSGANNPMSWQTSTYFKWIQWWRDRGISIQMLLTIIVATVMVWGLIASVHRPQMITNPMSDDDDIQPRGVYRTLESPSWSSLFLFLSRTSILLSIFWYGRIALPIPDLVAGTNVLKSVRAEAMFYRRSTNVGGKPSKLKQQFLNEEVSWAERYKSIAVENRFRLACKVAGIRILDGILACAVLPQTVLACRLTGHCPEHPALWELSSILHPIGLTGPIATQVSSMFRSVVPDRGSMIIVMISVVFITALFLLAQIVTLNGSFLAIMGYVSGEWTLVEDPPQDFEAPANWDPRRRYKKGDLIVHPGFGGGVYRALSNNPEGRPFDLFLRATHDLFRSEMGHSSTSQVIVIATKAHMIFISLIVCMIASYKLMDCAVTALVIALFSNLIASYGVLTTGLVDHNELAEVAREIKPTKQK